MDVIKQILTWIGRALSALLRIAKRGVLRWWDTLQRQQTWKGKALVGCGGLLALLVACSILSFPFRGGGSATPTPTVQAVAKTQVTVTPRAVSTERPTNTPKPTNIPEPTQTVAKAEATATATPESTNTPRSTNTPIPPSPTPLPPTATPTPLPDAVVLVTSLNVRGGPGTVYDRVGSVSRGDPLDVTGRNSDGSWLAIEAAGGLAGWIAASPDLVRLNIDPMTDVSVVAIPPTPTPAGPPTATPAPQALVVISALSGRSTPEVVVVTNRGSDIQDMSGWRIQSYSPSGGCHPVGDQVFTFPGGLVLGPGASVRVLSGPGASGNPPAELFWTNDNIWNNGGDRADLVDAGGNVVSVVSYGACR